DFGMTSNAVAKFEPVSTVLPGSEIRLAVDDAKLHFFDPETHLAI
ncbi:MAG: ABC transporter ATP-binding protein, partial [Mesorhizobium sp.]